MGSVISISGLLLYGTQEGHGYLGFLNDHYYMYTDILLNIHIYTSYTLAAWAVVHISGVLVEQFYHKTNMVFAMVTGYKKAKGEDSEPGTRRGGLTYAFLLLSAFGGLNPPIFKISIYTPSIIIYRLFRIDNFHQLIRLKKLAFYNSLSVKTWR